MVVTLGITGHRVCPLHKEHAASSCKDTQRHEQQGADSNNSVVLQQALLKIDVLILPVIIVGSLFSMMDRSSMGNAKVSGLEDDLHLRQGDYNIATSLFYPTYLVFQPLSNWCLKRVGARIWLPLLTLLWGAVICAQAFVTSRGLLFTCRVLLGIPEAGYNSGALFLISFWYPRRCVSRRVAIFYTGTAIGSLISGPIALGLTKLNGWITSWHAIFFVEGLVTMCWALVMFVLVPNYPDDAIVLSSAERTALSTTLRSEKPEGGRRPINTRRFIRCLFNVPLLLVSLVLFCANMPINTIMLFGPQVVKDMGFSSSQAQAMQTLPGFCGLVAIIMANWSTQWYGSHYRAVIAHSILLVIGSTVLLATVNVGARMFALCLLGFGGFGLLGCGPGWLATNVAATVTMGSAGASVLVVCGGAGGIATSYIYRNQDAPKYMLGHGINLMAGILAIILALAARWCMGWRNHKMALDPTDISSLSPNEISELGDQHPDFRYVY
ncbi:hypothetical protein H4R20_000186 [Coemansia guatemalensis]|uniref:Major facilitator superfamily (MFS) profile domain-containing protein n=1 Tax=Coemansia guatemalensis TaxID=2761395 RepID=A0A9W8I5T4_9FUNG|nr:hypothetical protein H4R20_000186 [Coemansia guatemalensis]